MWGGPVACGGLSGRHLSHANSGSGGPAQATGLPHAYCHRPKAGSGIPGADNRALPAARESAEKASFPPMARSVPERRNRSDRPRDAMPFSTELRLALRSLTRAPGFLLLALLTLTLGIGTTAALFSITESVLWRPLPFPDSERLSLLSEHNAKNRPSGSPVSAANFLDWR